MKRSSISVSDRSHRPSPFVSRRTASGSGVELIHRIIVRVVPSRYVIVSGAFLALPTQRIQSREPSASNRMAKGLMTSGSRAAISTRTPAGTL